MEIKTTTDIGLMYKEYTEAIDRGDVDFVIKFQNEPDRWVKVEDVKDLHKKFNEWLYENTNIGGDINLTLEQIEKYLDKELK